MRVRFTCAVAALFTLVFLYPVSSVRPETALNEKKEIKEGEGLAARIKKDEKLKLTLDKVLNYLINQNLDVKKALLEYRSAPSDLKKYRGRYDFSLYGKAYHSLMDTSPENPSAKFQGTETIRDNYEVGIQKQFDTGTRISASINGLYQNVKGAAIDLTPLGGPLMNLGGEGYQSGVVLTLSQELLKNSFGMNDRLTEQSIGNVVEMKKRAVKLYLSNLLVQALVGYWNVSVAEDMVETYRVNLNSTTDIRNLVERKLNLGLSEPEELLDWNSKVLQGRNNFEISRKMLYDARLAVIRTLDLEANTDFEIGKTFQTTPPDITLERAVKDAYLKRVDLMNQRTLLKNAELELRMAGYNQLPSLKLNLMAGNTDYSEKSYMQTFNDLNKQWSVGLEATYPLGNTEAETRMQDAKLNYLKGMVELKRMEKEVRDEVDSLVKQCAVLFTVYQQTKKSGEYAQNYYFQVLRKFRQGRFSAVQLKLALDSYIFMRQAELKSLVDFNVALLRRDLARNVIFENYNINLDAILEKVK